jgi:hypothetical protein
MEVQEEVPVTKATNLLDRHQTKNQIREVKVANLQSHKKNNRTSRVTGTIQRVRSKELLNSFYKAAPCTEQLYLYLI